jgi:HPt (histidine-containing phosphotransfer) domain-containing protein
VDENVSIFGVLSDQELFNDVIYSPFIRFVAELPAVDFNLSMDVLSLFLEGFDALANKTKVDQIDPSILSNVVERRLLRKSRFFAVQELNQQIDQKVLSDFDRADKKTMIQTMDQTIEQSLQRIYKRPTRDNVRKVAHLIKGSSAQIGARGLYALATKTEKCCEADFDGPLEDIHENFAKFFLMMLHFLKTSRSLYDCQVSM